MYHTTIVCSKGPAGHTVVFITMYRCYKLQMVKNRIFGNCHHIRTGTAMLENGSSGTCEVLTLEMSAAENCDSCCGYWNLKQRITQHLEQIKV